MLIAAANKQPDIYAITVSSSIPHSSQYKGSSAQGESLYSKLKNALSLIVPSGLFNAEPVRKLSQAEIEGLVYSCRMPRGL